MPVIMDDFTAFVAQTEIDFAATLTVAAGLVFLVAGAKGACRMAYVLRKGRSWKILSGLIFVFIAGYALFSFALNSHVEIPLEYVALAILLTGSVFVWFVVKNAERTLAKMIKLKNLETMVNTDPLTGLSNRRFLDSRLDEELERCRRYERPCSVIMLDLDHFKRINDTHGHEAGDTVLSELGDILKIHFRNNDVVARYGGEEFVMVLVETTELEAVNAAERLRSEIEAHSFSICGKDGVSRKCLPVTASIGVAGYSITRDSGPSDLIRRADRAMYTAKKGGRNRVIVDQSTVAYVGEQMTPQLAPAFNLQDLGRISA